MLVWDTFKDKSGRVYECGKKSEGSDEAVVCFDARNLVSNVDFDVSRVYDVKKLYWHDGSLERLVKHVKPSGWEEFAKSSDKITAHTNAIREAKMDVSSVSLWDLIPEHTLREFFFLRREMITALFKLVPQGDLDEWDKFMWPLFQALLEIEKNGVKIDVDFVEKNYRKIEPQHVRSFLDSMRQSHVDGFVYSKFNPRASRTRRMSVESGFQAMSVPHGPPREAIISRHDGGEIWSFDFNAIDYRCIIKCVDDKKINDWYDGCADFHEQTAHWLFLGCDINPRRRQVAKNLTYIHVYGGAVQTIQSKMPWLSVADIEKLLIKLDELLEPVIEFRKNLAEESRKLGFVRAPMSIDVPIDSSFHDGKILGLFAQTFSSFVFGKSLVKSQNFASQNKILFPVHDEIVVDVHPECKADAEYIASIMQEPVFGMVPSVKIKRGKNYGEATG